ncbi:MAG: glutamine-hydrolyzing carbamoyl-phosphate synthase small subunit [Methanomicrobiales archaeon]|nr:glutamine-hydrolyzing carbamoyl-phosphate synthase small subunit [Methanomicrobiales archaeon]
MKAVLGFEDNDFVVGEGFGVEGICSGELVFTTQMTGYMEALSDPSYHGQILLFTYPLIGNYGVDFHNFQSEKVWARGCVVRELCRAPVAIPRFQDYFRDEGLYGIAGVDTRKITIKIREKGTIRAALIVGNDDEEQAISAAEKVPPISAETYLIPEVSCKSPYHIPGKGGRIAVIDLGIKKNMLVSLRNRDADIYVYPYNATYSEIQVCEPQALLISNGPGDPETAKVAIRTVQQFIGEIPIFGICMGNQITALALGGRTYKMKFGHRGTNQPVRFIEGSIFITTQNHSFAVDGDTLPEGCTISYTNANDGTVEGFMSTDLDITCVQFHPEAHGGPRDTENHYFDMIFRRLL